MNEGEKMHCGGQWETHDIKVVDLYNCTLIFLLTFLKNHDYLAVEWDGVMKKKKTTTTTNFFKCTRFEPIARR